jgi:2-polyprenyl-3-methyl-5-hydroxy-6-metoxy-1,4-benzoquinol methylase
MKQLRRAVSVVSHEGLAGLLRRISGKLHKKTIAEEVARQVAVLRRADEQQMAEARQQREHSIAEEVARRIAELHRAEEQRLAEARAAEAQRILQAEQEWTRQVTAEKAAYEKQAQAFRERTKAVNLKGFEHYYWYHTVDLGNGLVTPGDYDYHALLPCWGFPKSMAGMRVLDVGSATGFFAFEFERRGGDVYSVELPSLEDWDILHCDRDSLRQRLLKFFSADTPQEAYWRHLDGPFQFCKEALKSKVKRCFSTVYNLKQTEIGGLQFDFIYAGDILLHLFSPMKALDVLASMCRDKFMATIDVPFPGPDGLPLVAYLGRVSQDTDSRSWWAVSPTCIEQMFKRMGFKHVKTMGHFQGMVRRDWVPYRREVILASRSPLS